MPSSLQDVKTLAQIRSNREFRSRPRTVPAARIVLDMSEPLGPK
jgi:hypothetical protein